MSRLALLLGTLLVLAAVPLAAAGAANPSAPADSADSGLDMSNASTDTIAATDPPAQSNTTTENETDAPRLDDVAFFTTYARDSAPPVRIGFSAEPGSDGFFVLTNASGAVVGYTEYEDYDSAIHADGLPVPFTKPAAGITTLTVTAHDDTNGNREFDPGIDEPYREDGGQAVSSTMTFLFPNETDELEPEAVELIPDGPGLEALHHFRIEARHDMEIRAVAVNYRYTGVRVEGLDNDSAGVGAVYPGLSNRRTGAKAVDEPLSNVLVVEPDDPFEVGANDDFVLNVDGLSNPRDAQNVTIIVNPYGEARATTVTLEPGRAVPSIDMVQVSPDWRSRVTVNLHFPAGNEGVVEIRKDGDVIGRSQAVGGQPDMHLDFFDVRVDRELEPGDRITVTLLDDTDSDGTYEEPFAADCEPVSRTVTVLEGLETGETNSTPSTTTPTPTTRTPDPTTGSTTTTTVPGFGMGIALGALLLLGLLRFGQ